MGKVKIIFNGTTKVVEATEEFLKADALAEAAATNCLEHFWIYAKEQSEKPWIPEKEYDEDKAQEAASKLNNDFDCELAKLISKHFNISITSEDFLSESFQLTKQEEKEGIVISVEAKTLDVVDNELQDFTEFLKKHKERKTKI